MIRHSVRLALWLLALSLLLVSLLLLALRVALPEWEGLAAAMERRAGTWIDREVRIESLRLSWSGWVPELVADEVQISQPDGVPLRARELGVTLAPLRSLRARRPVPGEVRLAGIGLRLERDADGVLYLHGWQFGGSGSLAGDWQRHFRDLTRVRITDASLQWLDRGNDLHAGVQVTGLDLQSGPSGLRAVGRGTLLPEAGGAVYLGLRVPPSGQDRAEFYLEAENLQLAHWAPLAGLSAEMEGTSAVRLWGSVEDRRLRRLQGDHETRVLTPYARSWRVQAVGHRFLWRTVGDRATFSWAATTTGGGDGRIEYALPADGASGTSRVLLKAADVDLAIYARIADRAGPKGALELERWLPRAPSGQLRALEVLLARDDRGWRIETAEAEAKGLGVRALEDTWLPGIDGLDAVFVWHDGQADLILSSEGFDVDMPALFAGPLRLDHLETRAQLRHELEGWVVDVREMRVENVDAAAEGQGRLIFAEQPELDIALRFLRADGSRVADYLPVHRLPANTYRWLVESIREGRLTEGGMVYRGRPTDFPFDRQEGIFLARVGIENGVLDYQPGWPEARGLSGTLVFHNAGFVAEKASGRILDTEVRDATVRIADMLDSPVLEIRGTAAGPLDDLPDYLRRTGIGGAFERYGDHLRPGGESELDLDLRIPLHGPGPAATSASGRLAVQGALVEIPELPLTLRQVSGEIRFSPGLGVRGRSIRAVVHGETVRIDVDRDPDASGMQIRAVGRQPLDPWVGEQAWLQQVRGTASWNADLRIDDAGDSLLRLGTDLEGVEIDWPPPFAKTRGTRRPLDIVWPLRGQDEAIARVQFDSVLAASLRLAPRHQGQAVRSAVVQLGQPLPGSSGLPERGIDIWGRLPDVDVDAWLRLADTLRTGGIPIAAGDGLTVRRAELLVEDRLRWRGQSLPGLQLRVEARDDGHWLEARGDWLSGQGWVTGADGPQATVPGRGYWRLDLEHLRFDPWNGTAVPRSSAELAWAGDPRAWPALDVRIGALGLGDLDLADLDLRLSPVPEGLTVRLAGLRGPEGSLGFTGDGHWLRAPDGSGDTVLAVDASGSDWGSALASIGFSGALEQGAGTARARLSWPGALHAPVLETLRGRIELDIADGRLRDVEPGAGRLLGLVSLDVIPRRLRLDFRDVYTQGLSFDRLHGSAVIEEGDLVVSELRVRSPSALVRISGRTGLVAKDFDQSIVVVPRLRSTLPIVGALVGGPVAGAVVLLVERALGIGDQVEEAARVEYFVTGPWSNPEVRARVRTEQESDD